MKYFTIKELIETSTGLLNVPMQPEKNNLIELVDNVLDPLREMYGGPIRVNSGYRSPIVNKKVGGAATSQHVKGEAADITGGSKVENEKLFNLIYLMDLIKTDKYPIVISTGKYRQTLPKLINGLNQFFNKNYSTIASILTMFNGMGSLPAKES